MPDSTPEPESPSSVAAGQADYSMWPESDTERAGGQSPGQRRAGTEPPMQAEGSPAQPDAGTLELASPPRGQTGPGATSGGRSAGSQRVIAGPEERLEEAQARRRIRVCFPPLVFCFLACYSCPVLTLSPLGSA